MEITSLALRFLSFPFHLRLLYQLAQRQFRRHDASCFANRFCLPKFKIAVHRLDWCGEHTLPRQSSSKEWEKERGTVRRDRAEFASQHYTVQLYQHCGENIHTSLTTRLSRLPVEQSESVKSKMVENKLKSPMRSPVFEKCSRIKIRAQTGKKLFSDRKQPDTHFSVNARRYDNSLEAKTSKTRCSWGWGCGCSAWAELSWPTLWLNDSAIWIDFQKQQQQ